MSALAHTDEYERLWLDLIRQADSLTAAHAWPSIPGCELLAYDAADRVVRIIAQTPALRAKPYAERRAEALTIHRVLSWRTARSRAARLRGRFTQLDHLDPAALPAHHDSYECLSVTPEAMARAFMAEGVPPIRAVAIAMRIAHDLAWSDVRAALIRRGLLPPAVAVLRTQCARDIALHGGAVARCLGLRGRSWRGVARRSRSGAPPASHEDVSRSAQNSDEAARTVEGVETHPCLLVFV